MKLLSLWEPWATLMAIGAKRIETRSWGTSYRGWLAIQSANHFTAEEDDVCFMSPFRDALNAAGVPLLPYRHGKRYQFSHGCIVAVVNLEICLPTEAIVGGLFRPEGDFANEMAFGNYDLGRYGWITNQLFRLPEPIRFKGKQGLCDVDEATVAKIREQWRRRMNP